MDRPTKEVNLPVSGMKAVFYTYYTRGERKSVEAVMLESAEFEQDEAGKPKLKSVDATYRSKMEDKAVLLAVKHLLDKEGKVVEFNQKILDGLPEKDFEVIQEALRSSQPKKK